MRLALLALWVAVIVAALVPVLRRAQRPGAPPRIASDELVQDPVCGTYVVRSRAVSRGAAEGPHYFCSVECAGRFAG